MTTPRSYHDACALAHALDLIGERWAMLVVRELLFGPKRFTDLRSGLPATSANVLTQRLEELEAAGLVLRHRLPPPARAWVYELTARGHALEPALLALARWGLGSPTFLRDEPISPDGFALSLRLAFDPTRATDVAVALAFDGDRFLATIAQGAFTIARRHDGAADATLAGEPLAMAGVAYMGQDLDEAIGAGRLACTGDRAAAARFLGCFKLPIPC